MPQAIARQEMSLLNMGAEKKFRIIASKAEFLSLFAAKYHGMMKFRSESLR